MTATVEAVVQTANGMILVRDVGVDTREDQRAAAEAARIPGSRGRAAMIAAAGTVLQLRCAHQLTRPRVRLEIGANDGPYELTVISGRIAVDTGDGLACEIPAAPGTYRVAVEHQGREELQAAAREVEARTQHADAAATHAGWRELDGMESYRVLLWPA
ncbi:hypothetical protein Asp14428_74010 [Actinoplanes sp. NBRC 14428]|uniref:Uncharacterized protein n=1 Tax=Pseudosporangium ferrugineum TaxID=439699 RepID=A0A2T0RJD7_9ACTN|nr:hypothetical protein [Pseudosporangium ferrugineum]PRY21293.1 hypothetical protein CLV70_1202 [Pseudosporangium ferrugineum]BCJ55926.1 hypothetical protein Asp14428_74010 [Actinoplanes sp. NBRC 14428]